MVGRPLLPPLPWGITSYSRTSGSARLISEKTEWRNLKRLRGRYTSSNVITAKELSLAVPEMPLLESEFSSWYLGCHE